MRVNSGDPPLDALDGGEFVIGAERMAHLLPKLHRLIEDFRVLEALETDESEPGISPWRPGDGSDVRR